MRTSDGPGGVQHEACSQTDEIIRKWTGKLGTSGNFRVALPEIAAVDDPAMLKRIFEVVIPDQERHRMRRNQPYWQAFAANPSGKLILERLSLKLN